MNRQQILSTLKDSILTRYPASQIILFGSRSRLDNAPDADWDILILSDNLLTEADKITLHNIIFEIELETGELINPIIHSQQEWNNPFVQATPLYQNIVREGMVV